MFLFQDVYNWGVKTFEDDSNWTVNKHLIWLKVYLGVILMFMTYAIPTLWWKVPNDYENGRV